MFSKEKNLKCLLEFSVTLCFKKIYFEVTIYFSNRFDMKGKFDIIINI